MQRDRIGRGLRPSVAARLVAAMAGLILAHGLSTPREAGAQTLSVEETESLVHGVYYEGMPEVEAERIGPAGCARLVEMLADPQERRSHPQILLAIGICGPPGGFEAIRDWADVSRTGEIDRATFRAWQVLPFALGRMARHDRRALARLEAQLNASEAPDWTFRHHRGARLLRQARRSAANGLAHSGLPEAGEALVRADRSASDAGFREHLEEARAAHRRAAAERSSRGREREVPQS